MRRFDRILPPRTIRLPDGKTVQVQRSRALLYLLPAALGVVLSVRFTGFDPEILRERWTEFFVIAGQMIPPNVEYANRLWQPLADTIKMSLIGSLLGSLAAIPAAYAASSNMTRSKTVHAAAKLVLSVLRTLPTLVTALIATYLFGLGTLAGTVAIFLFTAAYVGKLLYEQIEAVDMGPFEAMESLGMTRIQAFRHAILRQVLPVYLSASLFCFEGNVRYAAILGYVGAGGIGLVLNENLGWRNYANVGMILALLIVTVFAIESVSEHFRKKLS